jgi:CDP-6-deoxy-D-xylo-4-hexulose-3-dehydrase
MTKSQIESLLKSLIREWASLQERPSKVRYSGPSLGPDEYEAALDGMLSGWWSGGMHTLGAERKLASLSERSHGLLVNSGSSANLVAMLAAKELYFKDGDKIITTACGFPTTASPIIYAGLTPVFVDVKYNTLNIDPGVVDAAAARDPRIRGVFVAHTLGFPCDIDGLLQVARRHNLEIFFDCCDAYGTTHNGRPIQAYGKFATFSFYVAHHVTMGEGGGIVTNDTNLFEAMRGFRSWGRYCAADKCCIRSENPNLFCPSGKLTRNSELPDDYIVNYQYEWLGLNVKPLDLQSAILSVQLDRLQEFNDIRKENYSRLLDYFDTKVDFFASWNIPDSVSPFAFPIGIVTDKFKRKHYVDFLNRAGIETRLLFGGNLTKHPAFVNCRDKWEILNCGNPAFDLEVSDWIMKNVLLLGVSQVVSSSQIDFIIDKTEEFLRSV